MLIDGSSKFKIGFEGVENFCVIGIAASDQSDQIILGAQFMQHYYTVIDMENQSYGFALNVKSRGYISFSFATNTFLLKVFLSVLGLLILTIVFAFALAKCRQKRWEKRLNVMKQMSDPNYLVKENENEVIKSFGSKRSFSVRSRARASFTNEFAYQQQDKRPHTKSMLSQTRSDVFVDRPAVSYSFAARSIRDL